MSQFRQNPISKHWVLIAPNRAKRPEQFSGAPVIHDTTPEIVTNCAFCVGNESKNAEIAKFPNNKDWQVRIIPNKFEALSHVPLSSQKEFYVSRSGSGDHEVIITRHHNEPIALQSISTVELTIHVLRQRYLDLAQHQHLAYIQIFHNHGKDAGASMIHPHYQIISTPMVPTGVHDEIMGCYHYFNAHQECIYCAIMKEEKKQQERVIFETEDFMVIAPYASRSPFETWILPKKHNANFEEISDKEITQLAYVLKVTMGQLFVKLSDPPLNFYLHTLPLAHAKHSGHDRRSFHWHLTIFPRLAYWSGFEYATGIPINPMTPEDATKFLK
ncbi:MAG: Galactose-phosphate uridylyltransferase [Candidatus Doudnabacteria bacterium]|nr:Galactose-phosphate uridylyltransferase [Candidatus Doudnabacteria bacterium]